MASGNDHALSVHTAAVVVPVYQETTLEPLIDELSKLAECTWTPGGSCIPRHRGPAGTCDRGSDRSDQVIRRLAEEHDFVRPVHEELWSARGPHSPVWRARRAEWVVTMDEDGQHDPARSPDMPDVAMNARAPLSTRNRRIRHRTVSSCNASSRRGVLRPQAGSAARRSVTSGSYRLVRAELQSRVSVLRGERLPRCGADVGWPFPIAPADCGGQCGGAAEHQRTARSQRHRDRHDRYRRGCAVDVAR